MELVQAPHNLLGSKLLSALGPKLYHNPKYALRELIQNAYDAINQLNRVMSEEDITATESRRIEIVIEEDTLHVLDSGVGMDINEVWEYCSLGLNKKVRRLDAGAHGVGTYAGAAIGHSLEVWTKKYGSNEAFNAIIDYDVIFDNETKRGTIDYIEYAEDLTRKAVTVLRAENPYLPEVHFTHVKIKLNSEAKVMFSKINEIHNFISIYCPVDFSPSTDSIIVDHIKNGMQHVSAIQTPIEIFVNNIPVYKQNIDNVRPIKEDTLGVDLKEIKIGEKVVAQVWLGLNRKLESIKDPLTKGIVLFLDGFMIDTDARPSIAQYFKRDDIAYYYTGEVHLLDSTLEPDLERTWIQPTPSWKVIESKLKELVKNLESTVQKRSQQENAVKSLRDLLDLAKSVIPAESALPTDAWELTELRTNLENWKKSVKKYYGPRKKNNYPFDIQTKCDTLIKKCDAIMTAIANIRNTPINDQSKKTTDMSSNLDQQPRTPFIFNQTQVNHPEHEDKKALPVHNEHNQIHTKENDNTVDDSPQPIEKSAPISTKEYNVTPFEDINKPSLPLTNTSKQIDKTLQIDPEIMYQLIYRLIDMVKKSPTESNEVLMEWFEKELHKECH
ncbi:ATP-binding protein [Tumebacillus permanentifrigoris]|uniref:Histidine kinase/DNA gyrase B/HSP90-like ATPase n=1 Tax=Tumebacillus permanentifrigoris TaxID=378543 RepID=A0A316D9Q1_9BACL|nr:ATP-binding protein [Tumebacillus permanentifrigoris]PWK13470.1 histidine kinase/DNA gyrase B/HSP90-like ATPase [Tumebacillus permanentifrigoris]